MESSPDKKGSSKENSAVTPHRSDKPQDPRVFSSQQQVQGQHTAEQIEIRTRTEPPDRQILLSEEKVSNPVLPTFQLIVSPTQSEGYNDRQSLVSNQNELYTQNLQEKVVDNQVQSSYNLHLFVGRRR